MNKYRWLLVSILVVIVGLNYTPGADGVTFNIGKQVASDISNYDYYVPFTSGAIVYDGDFDPVNYTKIFDGNLSTGIDVIYPSFVGSWIYYEIYFPYGLNVTNITVKPTFNGKTCNYTIEVRSHSFNPIMEYTDQTKERTFVMNCPITEITLYIYENGTDHYYFNDLLINYTLGGYNKSEVLQAVSDMSNSINSLQSQIDALKTQVSNLNDLFYSLNNTVNKLNFTVQNYVLQNITNLWIYCQQQNSTLNNLLTNFDELNLSTRENITELWQTNVDLNQSIINLTQKLDNLNLTKLQNLTQLQNEQKALSDNVSALQALFQKQNSSIEALMTDFDDLNASTKENITKLFTLNNQLSTSITDIYQKINSLNLTLQYNLTQLQAKLQSLQTDMSGISDDLDSLTADVDNIPELRDKIDKAASDIADIQKNITEIKNNLPSEYDDSDILTQIDALLADISALKDELLKLKSELPSEYDDTVVNTEISNLVSVNDLLKQRLAELQTELDNITSDMNKLDDELDTYKSAVDKESGVGDDDDSNLSMFLILFVIVFVILILIIIKLFSAKRKPVQTEGDDMTSNTVHDILTDRDLRDTRLHDPQYKAMLENKYQRGEISQETYFYIRSVLEVPDNTQNIGNRRT
jgi:uncharacterized coiled-coil DUF342 family protein/uncharacterized membrane protein